MKRVNATASKGRINSGSFLKVLMPRINKDSKRSHSAGKPSAPNLGGNRRGKR